MDSETIKKLKTLIEALAHSGSNTLDEDIFKQVKKICKSSQESIPHAYNLVLAQLKKKNSQVRLSAFQICKELFKRSALFRENVLKDLNLISELTAEINTSKKLPPPKSSAETLKVLFMSTLKEWVEEFGESYKKLKLAYNYLQKCKGVDFATFQVCNSAEAVAENEQNRHLRTVNEEKIRKILVEFQSNESEIKMIITSLSNCLSLLLPPAEEFFISDHNFQQGDKNCDTTTISSKNQNTDAGEESVEYDDAYTLNYKNSLREFGVPFNYNLTVHLNDVEKFKVSKTEENSSIIENAKDCVRLISNRFLPMIKKFVRIYCKCSNGTSNELKKIMDVKEQLENVLKKYNSLVIDPGCGNGSNEDSSDDGFEEVKKEGYEDSVSFSEEHMLECLKTKSVSTSSNPTSAESKNVPKVESLSSSTKSTIDFGEASTSKASGSKPLSRKERLLSIAPKLPYDIDLYHWEDENLTVPTLISTKIDVDKFWGAAGSDDIHEIPNPDGVAALRTRVIEYSGKFEPVKWSCRAPLGNGKLCPRKDRFKCPFHGKIIARDEMGQVQNRDDEKASVQSREVESRKSVPGFEDPEFLSDLEAATGLNLKIPEKRGKKRKSEQKNLTHKKMKTSAAALKIVESKKLPGLVDVVKRQNNAFTRLSKKIFNRSALRRVSSALNNFDRKKFLDKFGDQFNYV